jgi:hypothetical protein
VASGSDENWALGSPEDWPSWQAIGFDTEGEIIFAMMVTSSVAWPYTEW